MSEASDVPLTAVGLDEDLGTGHSIYTVETHIQHLAEAKLGDQITADADYQRR